jgi:hypothetical protein
MVVAAHPAAAIALMTLQMEGVDIRLEASPASMNFVPTSPSNWITYPLLLKSGR